MQLNPGSRRGDAQACGTQNSGKQTYHFLPTNQLTLCSLQCETAAAPWPCPGVCVRDCVGVSSSPWWQRVFASHQGIASGPVQEISLGKVPVGIFSLRVYQGLLWPQDSWWQARAVDWRPLAWWLQETAWCRKDTQMHSRIRTISHKSARLCGPTLGWFQHGISFPISMLWKNPILPISIHLFMFFDQGKQRL